jgi:hypothetical protein
MPSQTGLLLVPASGGYFTNPVTVLGHQRSQDADAKLTPGYCSSLILFILLLYLTHLNDAGWRKITSHMNVDHQIPQWQLSI